VFNVARAAEGGEAVTDLLSDRFLRHSQSQTAMDGSLGIFN